MLRVMVAADNTHAQHGARSSAALTLELKLVTRINPFTGGMDACSHARESITTAPVAASRTALRA